MVTTRIIGLLHWKKHPTSKMMMTRTNQTLSTRFPTPFSIMLPPLDALLRLATVFSITCVVVRTKPSPWPPNPFTPASRTRYMLSNSWSAVMKRHLTTKKPRSSFFILSPRITSKIMCTIANATLIWTPSKILRTSSKAVTMQIRPKRTIVTIVEVTRVNFLVVTTSLSRLWR